MHTILNQTGDLPWALPLLLASIVLGLVLARPLGRALSEPPWVAAMLVISIGLIVSYTLTPRSGASWASIVAAPADRTGLDDLVQAPWHWWPLDARSLNVLLFIPLGFAIAFIGRRWLRWAFIACAVVAPFAIEGVQLVVSRLDRLPQWVDVVDNITGVVIGLLLGLAVSWMASRRGGPVRQSHPDD